MVATWLEKPKTSLYHLIKLGRVSESRAIANDVDGVKSIGSSQARAILIAGSLQLSLCLRSLLCRWSGAVVKWVCINWKDTAVEAI